MGRYVILTLTLCVTVTLAEYLFGKIERRPVPEFPHPFFDVDSPETDRSVQELVDRVAAESAD